VKKADNNPFHTILPLKVECLFLVFTAVKITMDRLKMTAQLMALSHEGILRVLFTFCL
jgi:hypothetical protein